MEHDLYEAGGSAYLHLHRGFGLLYGAVALVVLVLIGLGASSYLAEGRLLMGLVTVVVGLGVAAFVGLLSFSVLAPGLSADAAGVRGRMGWGRSVDARWEAVSVDVDTRDDAPTVPGRLRIEVGQERLTIDFRSWVGFADFLHLVAASPPAWARLTDAARHEVARQLRIET